MMVFAGRAWTLCMVGVLLVLGAGCTRFELRHPDGRVESMGKKQFKAYVREVFRRQNRATDGVIAALYSGNEDVELARAEEAMQISCALLIDLVQAKIERRALPLQKKLKMPEVAPRCEAAVARVEALLPKSASRL